MTKFLEIIYLLTIPEEEKESTTCEDTRLFILPKKRHKYIIVWFSKITWPQISFDVAHNIAGNRIQSHFFLLVINVQKLSPSIWIDVGVCPSGLVKGARKQRWSPRGHILNSLPLASSPRKLLCPRFEDSPIF